MNESNVYTLNAGFIFTNELHFLGIALKNLFSPEWVKTIFFACALPLFFFSFLLF